MTTAMDVIGGKFQRAEIYVPEMLISARAMKEAMAILEPVLVGAGIRAETRAVVGTIQGDLHDIGKNLVAMMWKGASIDVIDLGTNVNPEQFVTAVREHEARLVGVSALLTTTMVNMRDVVVAIRAADLGDVKIIIGGAPVTQEFADQIGADGYAPDAGSAVEVAKRVLGRRSPRSDPPQSRQRRLRCPSLSPSVQGQTQTRREIACDWRSGPAHQHGLRRPDRGRRCNRAGGRRRFPDLTVPHPDDPVAGLGDLRVVGHQHECLAVLRLNRLSVSRTSVDRSESRLPVGSSASTSLGLLTNARARATRCCSPPDSSEGRWRAGGVRG